MKLIKSKQFWIITTAMLSLGYIVSCTKKDQIIIPGAGATVSTTTLVSVKTTTAPTIDGTVEALWKNARSIESHGRSRVAGS